MKMPNDPATVALREALQDACLSSPRARAWENKTDKPCACCGAPPGKYHTNLCGDVSAVRPGEPFDPAKDWRP